MIDIPKHVSPESQHRRPEHYRQPDQDLRNGFPNSGWCDSPSLADIKALLKGPNPPEVLLNNDSDEELVDNNFAIGTILKSMNWLQQNHIDEGLFVASQLNLPLGLALVLRGFISMRTLRVCVAAQWRLREGFLSVQEGKEVLWLCARNSWSIDDAIIAVCAKLEEPTMHRLGHLVTTSGLVTADQLNEALLISKTCCAPLGRVLVHMELVNEIKLATLIGRQSRLRGDTSASGLSAAETMPESARKPGHENPDRSDQLQLSNFVARPESELITLFQLLTIVGFLSESRIDTVVRKLSRSDSLITQALCLTNKTEVTPTPSLMVDTIKTSQSLQYILQELFPQQRQFFDTAVALKEQISNKQMTGMEAIIKCAIAAVRPS